MHLISVVIPAHNEEENIPRTLAAIPVDRLREGGFDVEILVVDNASTDATGHVARAHGARVIAQPVRGYGNAYKAGFANCGGDVIATGDADLTYPWEILPEALHYLDSQRIDFITTNRLAQLNGDAMTRSHIFGNHALSFITRALFRVPFRDSQSGMWIFRRHVLEKLHPRSGGMAFSQELKIEAYRHGFRCHEMPIAYFPRGGKTKNRTFADGIGNLCQLIAARLRPSGLRSGGTAGLIRPALPAPALAGTGGESATVEPPSPDTGPPSSFAA